jgi:hypothetical protein
MDGANYIYKLLCSKKLFFLFSEQAATFSLHINNCEFCNGGIVLLDFIHRLVKVQSTIRSILIHHCQNPTKIISVMEM